MLTRKMSALMTKELKYLLLSPIGWVVLVLFAFQTSSYFGENLSSLYESFVRGREIDSFSKALFTDHYPALFSRITTVAYLFVPLITMAAFSRELQSGSIALLLSSPVSAVDIVVGKFLAFLLYFLSFLGIVALPIVFSHFAIENFDFWAVIPGMLGLLLLFAAFASIGIFVSSLTEHQIVAAIATLAVLFTFSSVSDWFGATPVLNEVAYWASFSGRAADFNSGLIASENVIYYLAIILIFLSLSTIRVMGIRSGTRWPEAVAKGGLLSAGIVCAGWFSSSPQYSLYFDFTENRRNSITQETADLMERLEGEWKVETVANLFDSHASIAWPRSRIQDRERWRPYSRENYRLSMTYQVYQFLDRNSYWAQRRAEYVSEEILEDYAPTVGLDPLSIVSSTEMSALVDVDLAKEEFRTIRVLGWRGRREILRYFDDIARFPGEREISAAIKRLLVGPQKVLVSNSNGERSITRKGAGDVEANFTNVSNRYALVNQGFDVEATDLNGEIATGSIVAILDPQTAYSDGQMSRIQEHMELGGDLLLAVEAGTIESVDSILESIGLRRGSVLVQESTDFPTSFVFAQNVNQILSSLWKERVSGMPVGLSGAIELDLLADDKSFRRIPIAVAAEAMRVRSHDGSSRSPRVGTAPVAGYALERSVGDATQRVIVLGDADLFSTALSEMKEPAVYSGLLDALYWLSDNRYPVQLTTFEASDTTFVAGSSAVSVVRLVLSIGVPLAIAVFGSWLLLTRRRR